MHDVARELRALYGSADPPVAGVLHVVHAARGQDGRLAALRIGAPSTPRSESDFFVLNAARAHADAVLTSAENLRREPGLRHALQGPWAGALAAYRRDALGKSQPLTVAILTRSGDLPARHPVWSDGTRKLVLTPASNSPPPTAGVREGAGTNRVQTLHIPDLDTVSATRWLQAQGHAVISVEAGPRTVGSLYLAGAIEELWLTRWESLTPDAELAGALPEDALLFRGLALVGSATRSEGGHSFRFERWRAAR